MTERRLRVMLVDDHPLVRSAVREAIAGPDLELVGEAATGEEALVLAVSLRPDILLLDIDLPGVSGLRVVRELVPRLPETRIIMLTVSHADRDVLEAMRLGAAGYLTKDLSHDGLARAVRSAAEGELAMNRRMAARVVRGLASGTHRSHDGEQEGDLERLSGREMEVLRLLADGLTDREIAAALTVSPRTVETHVGNVLRKLGVRNRAEAAGLYRSLE